MSSSSLLLMLSVASGGAFGALCRFWIREFLPLITHSEFPYATLSVNVAGCFAAGFLYTYLANSGIHWSVNLRAFVFIGFLGAFTTFSAFAVDSLIMLNAKEMLRLAVNIVANCSLSLIAVFIGAQVGGKLAA